MNQPPIDNKHVAPGCEPFSAETVSASSEAQSKVVQFAQSLPDDVARFRSPFVAIDGKPMTPELRRSIADTDKFKDYLREPGGYRVCKACGCVNMPADTLKCDDCGRDL